MKDDVDRKSPEQMADEMNQIGHEAFIKVAGWTTDKKRDVCHKCGCRDLMSTSEGTVCNNCGPLWNDECKHGSIPCR